MTTQDWYSDDNGNRCSVEYFGSSEAAQNALASLVNCYNCSNCSNCSDCSYCSSCKGCSYCSDCSDCSSCKGCSYCSDCSDCYGCSSKTSDLPSTPIAASEPAETDSKPEWDYFQGLVNIARRSADKAKEKYPQPNYVTLKIAEEAGEVVRGAVHYAEGRMEWDEVQGEIIQLLAMLIRFVTEGDEVNGVKPPDLITMKGMLK